MARKQQNIRVKPSKPKIYVEGDHEWRYLTKLQKLGVIKPIQRGTPLDASAINKRIEAIKEDLKNGIEVFWIVDGGDQHFQESKDFNNIYKEQRPKLSILINHPSFEFWYLLHEVETGSSFKTANQLISSAEFKKHFPSFDKTKPKSVESLLDALSKAHDKREKAIARAKKLSEDREKPQAEIYRLFDSTFPKNILISTKDALG